MKIFNIKNSMALTTVATLVSSNAFAASSAVVARSLADWVSLVSEILSFLCLAVFILYVGKYLKVNKDGTATGEEATKTVNGVKNGIMTALVGIAICQAVVIVAQAVIG